MIEINYKTEKKNGLLNFVNRIQNSEEISMIIKIYSY